MIFKNNKNNILDEVKASLEIEKLREENKNLKEENKKIYNTFKALINKFGSKEIILDYQEIVDAEKFHLYIEKEFLRYGYKYKLIDEDKIFGSYIDFNKKILMKNKKESEE